MQYWLIYIILFIIGALIFYILKGVCGCKTVEGQAPSPTPAPSPDIECLKYKKKTDCNNDTNNNCFWTGFPSGLDKIDGGIYEKSVNKCLSVYRGSMGETIQSRIDDDTYTNNHCGDQNTSKCCWNGLIDEGQWIDKESVCCQSKPILTNNSWHSLGDYSCVNNCGNQGGASKVVPSDKKCDKLISDDLIDRNYTCTDYYQKNSGGTFTACKLSAIPGDSNCTDDYFHCNLKNGCCVPDMSISEDLFLEKFPNLINHPNFNDTTFPITREIFKNLFSDFKEYI